MNGRAGKPLTRVLTALEEFGYESRRVGRAWSVRCPAHDDRNPSLRVSEGDEGRVLLYCHAGCSIDEILAKLSLKSRDLFPRRPRESGEVTTYIIRNEHGVPVARHIRTDFPGGDKTFWWEQADGTESLGGLPVAKLPLYGAEHVSSWPREDAIVVCEGEKAANALKRAAFHAVGTVTGASGCPSRESLEVFRDRKVILWPDASEKGRGHMVKVGSGLREIASEIRVFDWAEATDDADAHDYLVRGETAAERLRSELQTALGFESWRAGLELDSDTDGESQQDAVDESQVTRLLALAEGAELSHSPDREAYATIKVDDHCETYAISSRDFCRWLRHRWFQETQSAPRAQAMADALATLEARALFSGPCLPVFVRVGELAGKVYLDLGDECWRAVEIGPLGWRVISDPPVRFRRPGGLGALPVPERGGNIDQLRQFLNVEDDRDWILAITWLITAFLARGPYAVLILSGEQGSAKTTIVRILRDLLDPSQSPVRSQPRDDRDLMIAAHNGWILAFDNVSHLRPWLSDALCRVATGGGLSTRTLYTDAEETIFDACRPVILNGIEDVAVRGDLLDRALLLTLPQIDAKLRKDEKQFGAEFQALRPQILGAVLDVVSAAMRVEPGIRLKSMPRMADFARWGAAASVKLGWGPGEFLGAYEANRQRGNEIALGTSPVADAVRRLVEADDCWTGSATELLHDLVQQEGLGQDRANRAWPKDGTRLSGVLRRLAPNLRDQGVRVEFGRTGKSRSITLVSAGHECARCAAETAPVSESPSSALNLSLPAASSRAAQRHTASSAVPEEL